MNQKYPNLSKPIKIGNITARHRLFSAPTGLMGYAAHGHISTDNRAYFEIKARGGCAVVSLGECIVHGESGSSHNLQPDMTDISLLPTLTNLVKDIKRHGALASVELSHGGKYGGITSVGGENKDGKVAYGVSEEWLDTGEHVCEMPVDMIKELVRYFGKAAFFAKRAGFDMVNIHAAHGWIITQFLSPLQNHRKDEYGGSFENRARFLLEVLDEVRQSVGRGFPIEIRLNGDDFVEGGLHLADYIELAKMIEDKVDLINVSCGSHEVDELFVRTHPSMFLEHGCNVYLASEIKKAVKVPVSCVGGLNDPAQCEEIIASGKADIIELGRALLADPELPKKVFSGREDEISPCLRCFECFGESVVGMTIQCSVNPVIGNELDEKQYYPDAKEPKKVLIAGGGPGGMQAAIKAAKRGHQVLLCEKSGDLGGALKFARAISFKQDLYRFSQVLKNRLLKSKAEVLLNTEVTAELVEQYKPDTVFIATGARPFIPPVSGINQEHVYLASQVEEMDPAQLGEKIVILGGGLVGCETAIHLGMSGKDVTIIEMRGEAAADANCFHKTALKLELEKYVKVQVNTTASSIEKDGIVCKQSDGTEIFYKADSIICAAGMIAENSLEAKLRGIVPEVIVIGDAQRPRKVTEAVFEGYYRAKYL